MRKRKKAQSILEYVIVLSAIIMIVIAASNTVVKKAITKMFADSTEVVENQTTNFLDKVGKDKAAGN